MYFDEHHIETILLVYRAMEIDKDISTIERMLSDFKK